LAALALEALLGYPDWLDRRIPHPVIWIGVALDAFVKRWNRPTWSDVRRRWLGVATLILVAGASGLAGFALQSLLGHGTAGILAASLLATTGLAQRSLHNHVAAVARPLERGDLPAAREAVGRIVGRDTALLDASGVAAAALESLAESFNDGVVAPAFWLFAAGLPGLFAFKAINTADSMIGHREPRWRAFGWSAARTDDLVNLIPARIAGGLIALAGGRGWRLMFRTARLHASPNAGWPEAAMAGALQRRLGGPAAYDGVLTDRPWFGTTLPPPGSADLRRGLTIYLRACGLMWLMLGVGAVAWRR
jgi:adenosylcobinamide-phosphate synthase